MNFSRTQEIYFSAFAYQKNDPYYINRRAKVLSSIPIMSTLVACAFFYSAAKTGFNGHERLGLVIRGILAFVPGVNLSLILIDSIATIAYAVFKKPLPPRPFNIIKRDSL